MNWLTNGTPKIRERQIAFQALQGKEFVYLRKPGSKVMFAAYMTLWSAALLGSGFQLVQYVRGKATKSGE